MRRWLPYGTMCLGGSALIIVGYSRSLMCAPNGIALDIDYHIFEVTTIYEHDVCKYTHDCFIRATVNLVCWFDIYSWVCNLYCPFKIIRSAV